MDDKLLKDARSAVVQLKTINMHHLTGPRDVHGASDKCIQLLEALLFPKQEVSGQDAKKVCTLPKK